ncbi:MAG: pyrroline-5-carboxylate reductase [Candidatus Ratteibacteria bacterium]|nr:pyrroline-5-carboxylate reductase [Candidatus Ratteibacteria bacterium]
MINKKIGIIGCGNMGEALLYGLISKNIFKKQNIFVSEKQETRLRTLKRKYSQISFAKDNKDLAKKCSVIILAVKPQDIKALLEEISPFLTSSHLLISIAAGIKISFIEETTKEKNPHLWDTQRGIPIIRAMPNLPAIIGEGISVYSVSKNVSTKDKKITEEIFGSVGKVLKLKENKLDAVTAISGSGPAYVFYMLEAMIEAGLKLGFKKEEIRSLSVQTIIGAIDMIEKGECPAILRQKVTSPKGTTEAALKVLIENKWKEILIEAINKAEKRSKEFSK